MAIIVQNSRKLLIAILLLTFTGCTRHQVYENLYEGIRVRNLLQTPPPERGAQQEVPNYHQYRNNERKRPEVAQ